MVDLKRVALISSKRARVMFAEKSSPWHECHPMPYAGSHPSYLEKRVHLNGSLSDAGKRALSTFASASQSPEGTGIFRNVEFCLPLELIFEMLKKSVIKVLSAEMGITISCLNSENATADIQERYIEGSPTEVKDKNVTFGF
jgi:hypothetical protein